MRLKNYETVFILTPVLANEVAENIIAKFKNFLLEKGSKIIHEEAMGLKKLAYPIKQKNTGIYHAIEFQTDNPQIVGLLTTAYKREESIMRFIILALDKHGVEYNEKKRNGVLEINPKEKPKQEVAI